MIRKTFYSKILITLLFFCCLTVRSQHILTPLKGYSQQIGTMVSMMEDIKQRITNTVQHLNQEGTDFILDPLANSLGALILHLAAVEKYYQVYTFENRGFNEEEQSNGKK